MAHARPEEVRRYRETRQRLFGASCARSDEVVNPAVRRVVEDSSAEGIGTRLRDNWPLCAQNWREVCSGYASDTIFRADRFNRGGDHSSFDAAGFAAVRFTTPEEGYAQQHKATDTFANSSPGYATSVTRVNGAALASLALAPAPPAVTGMRNFGVFSGRITANRSRGSSGPDAQMRWSLLKEKASPELAGFAIVIRATTASF